MKKRSVFNVKSREIGTRFWSGVHVSQSMILHVLLLFINIFIIVI